MYFVWRLIFFYLHLQSYILLLLGSGASARDERLLMYKVMRKFFFTAALLLFALSGQAQEKVMNILKTDGTRTQTRVAELQEITFLTVEEGGQGLLVTTTGGETVSVLFEANPVVTITQGRLTIKSSAADAMEFEITDIAEIRFGDASGGTAIQELKGVSLVLQAGGAVLREIPEGVQPRVYTVDGQSVPTPPLTNGELRLSRETLGTGIYIVKAGTFTAKIRL